MRPRRPVPAPPAPDTHDADFHVRVAAWRARLGEADLRERLRQELSWMQAEQTALVAFPDPGSAERDRLDAWFRARSRRVSVLAAALAEAQGTPAPHLTRPPNEVGESPCELAREARLRLKAR